MSGALWTDAAIRRAFEADGAEMRVVAECEYIATAIGLVAHGSGVCLVDPLSAQNMSVPHVVTRPFEPDVFYDVGLLRPASREFDRLAAAFVERLESFMADYA